MRWAAPLLVLAVACGGRQEVLADRDAGADAGGTPDGGAMDGGSTDGGPSDAGSMDSGADSAVGTDGGDPDASRDAATDAAAGDGLEARLTGASVGANCMPIVPADPFSITFTVAYDNTTGATAATANILASKASFSDGSSLDLTVTPVEVGPVAAGATESITHTKTASSPALGDPCARCGGTVTVEAQVELGGGIETLTSTDLTVECVY